MTPVEVLAELVAAEHAAIYAYGVLGARLDDRGRTAALAAYDAHRQSRDSLIARLRALGATVPGPSAAYDVQAPDRGSALAVAIRLETGLGVLWRDLITTTGRTAPDLDLRRLALRNLADGAVRATRWRLSAHLSPATLALPGQP